MLCEALLLGQMEYQTAWDLQAQLAAEVAAGARPPALMLLEHPHTFTFGRRGNAKNLLWDEAEQTRRGVSVHWVDRGGDVTYHGPGQLVGYPILQLSGGDYVGYIRKLELTLVKTLARVGIVSGQVPGMAGVWVQPDVASRCLHCPPAARKLPSKIASVGVKVDANGVSRHGFALNIRTDPAYWQGIVGCGLEGYPVINAADLLTEAPEMEAVIDRLLTSFDEVFGYSMRVIDRWKV